MANAKASVAIAVQSSFAKDRDDEEHNKRQRRRLLKIQNEEHVGEGPYISASLPLFRS